MVPTAEFVEIPAERKGLRHSMYRHAVFDDVSCTRSQRRFGVSPARRRAAQGFGKLIEREARDGKQVLVVGPQGVTGNPSEGRKPLIEVPAGVSLAHFNGFRGLGCLQDV